MLNVDTNKNFDWFFSKLGKFSQFSDHYYLYNVYKYIGCDFNKLVRFIIDLFYINSKRIKIIKYYKKTVKLDSLKFHSHKHVPNISDGLWLELAKKTNTLLITSNTCKYNPEKHHTSNSNNCILINKLEKINKYNHPNSKMLRKKISDQTLFSTKKKYDSLRVNMVYLLSRWYVLKKKNS